MADGEPQVQLAREVGHEHRAATGGGLSKPSDTWKLDTGSDRRSPPRHAHAGRPIVAAQAERSIVAAVSRSVWSGVRQKSVWLSCRVEPHASRRRGATAARPVEASLDTTRQLVTPGIEFARRQELFSDFGCEQRHHGSGCTTTP